MPLPPASSSRPPIPLPPAGQAAPRSRLPLAFSRVSGRIARRCHLVERSHWSGSGGGESAVGCGAARPRSLFLAPFALLFMTAVTFSARAQCPPAKVVTPPLSEAEAAKAKEEAF